MRNAFLVLVCSFLYFTTRSQTIYIVRHAEKASSEAMTAAGSSPNDPVLSEAGKARANALRKELLRKKIAYIFTTNTIRTKTTAQPLAEFWSIPIQTYSPMPKASFIDSVKRLGKNVLIVGHSNTVDDLANAFAGKKVVEGDLADSEYDNLFIITLKGNDAIFKRKKYGKKSN